MYELFFLIILFGLGVFLQAIILLRDKFNLKRITPILLICLIAFFPSCRSGDSLTEYNLNVHIGAYFIFFSLVFAAVFQKEILPAISEKTILIFTLVFWYLSFRVDVHLPFCFFLGIVPTLGTIFLMATNHKIGFKARTFFYVWFLIMIIVIAFFQFSLLDPLETPLKLNGPFDAIITGMAFLYLFSHLLSLYLLIPLPGKNQSLEDRIYEVKKHMQTLSSKFSDHQLAHPHSLLIIFFGGAILLINYFLNLLPDFLLVNAVILIIPQIPRKIPFITT